MKLFFCVLLLSNLLGVEATIVKGVRSRVLQEGGVLELGSDQFIQVNATGVERKKSYYDDDYYHYDDDYYNNSSDSEDVEMHKTIEVTNLAFGQPLGRFFVMSHSDEVPPLFELGNPATNALALLAETGDPQHLVHSYTGRPGVFYAGIHDFGAPYEGGESTHITLPVTEMYNYITIAAMAVNTNDCFVAVNGVQLDVGDSPFLGLGYDAGSEENNELCSSVPGPACPPDSGNEDSGNGEGFVHVHRGISGIGDLSVAAYKWLNPMIRVEAVSETVHETSDESPSGSSDNEVCYSDLGSAISQHVDYLQSVHVSNTDATCGNRTLMAGMSPFIEHVRDVAVSKYDNVTREDIDECDVVQFLQSRNASLAPLERAQVSMRNEVSDTFECISDAAIIFEQMIWIVIDLFADVPKSVRDVISVDMKELLLKTPNAIDDVVDVWKASCDGKSDLDCNADKAWSTFKDFCELFSVSEVIGFIDSALSWWQKVGVALDLLANITAAVFSGGAEEVLRLVSLIDGLVDLAIDVANMIDACTPPGPCTLPESILGQDYSATDSRGFSYTLTDLGRNGSRFDQTGQAFVGNYDYCSDNTVYYTNGWSCGGDIGDRQGQFTANLVTDSSIVGTTVEEISECRYEMVYNYTG